MGTSGTPADPGRVDPAVSQRQGQACGHARPPRGGPHRLPAHDRGNLRCCELSRSGRRVRTRRQPQPGLFIRLFADGFPGDGLRAPRRRRFATRGRPDLRGGCAGGDIRRRLPFLLRFLGAHGDFIGAAGVAAPRTGRYGGRVPVPSGPPGGRAHPPGGNRASLVPDRLTFLRRHGSVFPEAWHGP